MELIWRKQWKWKRNKSSGKGEMGTKRKYKSEQKRYVPLFHSFTTTTDLSLLCFLRRLALLLLQLRVCREKYSVFFIFVLLCVVVWYSLPLSFSLPLCLYLSPELQLFLFSSSLWKKNSSKKLKKKKWGWLMQNNKKGYRLISVF